MLAGAGPQQALSQGPRAGLVAPKESLTLSWPGTRIIGFSAGSLGGQSELAQPLCGRQAHPVLTLCLPPGTPTSTGKMPEESKAYECPPGCVGDSVREQ